MFELLKFLVACVIGFVFGFVGATIAHFLKTGKWASRFWWVASWMAGLVVYALLMSK